MKKIKGLFLAIILIVLDQVTKYVATAQLKGQEPVNVIKNVFQFCYLENNGAVWGIFGGKTVFLLILTSLLLIFVVYAYLRLPADQRYTPLRIIACFIIAGGIGNMIDRFTYGYVVDFLYFKLIDFPIFNVADIYITVSVVILFLLFFFHYKEEDFAFLEQGKKKKEKSQD